jgi:thioredoxin 1
MKEIKSLREYNEAIQGQYVLIKFGAPWCGPCKLIEPELKKLSKAGYTVYTLNIDDNNVYQPAVDLGIMSVPTTVVFNEGIDVARTGGFKTLQELTNFVEGAKQ